MDVTEATRIVNSLATMPGLTLVAEDATNRFEATVRVRTNLATVNSDEDQAPDYSQCIAGGARAAFYVQVGDLADVTELVARVLDRLVENVTHELREFTRVPRGGGWWSPLHPHKNEGIQAWARHAGTDINLDYSFGTA